MKSTKPIIIKMEYGARTLTTCAGGRSCESSSDDAWSAGADAFD